jgi:hypothetical protein
MGRFFNTIASAALAGGVALSAGTPASAAYCSSSQSFFGVIQRMNGNMLTVSTDRGRWATVRIEPGARVNTNGMALRPGAFIGAYGCVAPGGVFDASEVTLSASRGGYNESLSGVVERVASNRLTVRQSGRGYGTWYVADADRFSVGQQISGTGMLGANGVFYPQTIDGQNVAYIPESSGPVSSGTITLSGVVRRVGSGSLVVWEPSHGTTGTWIVRDAGRFRVGQRLVARGTEDRSGRFYPVEISFQ